jgi:hypothetical protein
MKRIILLLALLPLLSFAKDKNGFAREYYGEAKQSWCD